MLKEIDGRPEIQLPDMNPEDVIRYAHNKLKELNTRRDQLQETLEATDASIKDWEAISQSLKGVSHVSQ